MAKIKQIGPGRKTSGTIDGITYVTRKGKTYVRSTPTMPISAYRTAAARKRQAIFKMIQMHLKYHLRTIRQTFTPKGNGSPTNRYYSVNNKALNLALADLADRLVAGEDISLTDVETAISTYAAAHPTSIRIASLSGYQEVYLTGTWPDTITLRANGGDSTIIIIVAENGTTTTINPDGTTMVVSGSNDSGSNGSNNGTSGSGTGNGGGSETQTVAAPTINGSATFTESTEVTITGPAGAVIHYTTDGSTPTAESTQYSAAFTLTDTTTVKAIAVKDGVSSAVTTKAFTKASAGGSDDGGGEGI